MTRSHKPVTTGRGSLAALALGFVNTPSAVKSVAASALSQPARTATLPASTSLHKLEIVDLSAEQINRIEEICAADVVLPAAALDAISKPWKAPRG